MADQLLHGELDVLVDGLAELGERKVLVNELRPATVEEDLEDFSDQLRGRLSHGHQSKTFEPQLRYVSLD